MMNLVKHVGVGLTLFLCILAVCGQTVSDIDKHSWQQAYNENQKLLVLFYKEENCEKCKVGVDSLNQMLGQPEISEDLELGLSVDMELAKKLGVEEFPSLVFLRDKSYVFFDGEYEIETMLEWVQQASEKILKRLGDDSFEHLTQASTGATTGDWLVAFYSEPCKGVLPILETLGVKIRAKTNVAKVNIAENPVLAERFDITKCPEIILFKQGKMYRYEQLKRTVANLKSFVEGFYRNSKAERVPGQKSSFDHMTENIADYIKTQLRGENRTPALAAIVGVAVALLLVIVCCCRSVFAGGKSKGKQKRE